MTTVDNPAQPVTQAQRKKKIRGFVMTGGGAKGLYEAGVINAFHLTGMEFDVITGSSIGAMNSIFFAEYLYHKHGLAAQGVTGTQALIDRLDERVRAYHHAWLMMPTQKIVDDSDTGPLGRLKDDLSRYSISLPLILQSLWWYTDPNRTQPPAPPVMLGLGRLLAEIFPRLAGGVLVDVIKNHKPLSLYQAARAYLDRFGMQRSLVPPANQQLKRLFITPVTPLSEAHLQGAIDADPAAGSQRYLLVDPARTLGNYLERDIAVRLTRANYRTGRLEISQAVSTADFVRFLDKYDWLWEKTGPDKLPLGSFRIQVPGNPNAVDAGLCSGRFPGVFAPFPVEDVYHAGDDGNALLYRLLAYWLNDREVIEALRQAYQQMHPTWSPDFLQKKFDALIRAWDNMPAIGVYFPRAGDVYVDGGSIDNTPSNSAVDYVREWIDKNGLSRRDYQLELFMIYLSTEPKIDMDAAPDPAIFDVVSRTFKIQGTATKTADANNVEIINTFGDRAEAVARTLSVVLQNYQAALQGLDADEQRRAMDQLSAAAQAAGLGDLDGLAAYLPGDASGLLERIGRWDEDMMKRKLPLEVEAVKIYPEVMPMDTLQFTERLGYKQENAVKMLTSGCYDTLWALRGHLEAENAAGGQPQAGRAPNALDDRDWSVLQMARQWMGSQPWPADPVEQANLRQAWRCQRGEACVYYKNYCAHGAGH